MGVLYDFHHSLSTDGVGIDLPIFGVSHDTPVQRSLERSWKTPLLVALAFNAQMVDSIPVGHHDVPVDVIVTPRGPILCTRRGEEEWP